MRHKWTAQHFVVIIVFWGFWESTSTSKAKMAWEGNSNIRIKISTIVLAMANLVLKETLQQDAKS